jgi:hypothetical protein
MIIFASSYQLEIFSKSERWHIDGTFDASPKQFYQVYTIPEWLRRNAYLCVYFVDQQKTNIIPDNVPRYHQMWQSHDYHS